jgi:putative restriction endonuclease
LPTLRVSVSDQARQGACRWLPACERRLHDPTYEVPSDRLAAVEVRVRQLLIQRVRDVGVDHPFQAALTYTDLCNAIDPDHRFWPPPRFKGVGKVLDRISTYEHHNGRPLLSALVIQSSTRHAGDGFVRLCRRLGQEVPSGQELAFCRAQIEEVARYWVASGQVGSTPSQMYQAKSTEGSQRSLIRGMSLGVDETGRMSALAARLSPEHIRRLAWFDEHTGDVLPRPGPLDGLLALVHPRRGIYKPAGLKYAVSITAVAVSPYTGDRVDHHADGKWVMAYHQENPAPGRSGEVYTNIGLIECLRDKVPVGVLQERRLPGRGRMFEVLGLAMPVDWQSGYFILESLRSQGHRTGSAFVDVLVATAEELNQQEDEQLPLPADDYDARLRTVRQIVARRGQPAFRASLLTAYSGRCAVTGCAVMDVLEAAHLLPYRGPESHNVRNGLLLRSDIHTLLDLMLLAFVPDKRTVAISTTLRGTQYDYLSNRPLAEPFTPGQRPAREVLDVIWQKFIAQEALRL